MPSFAERLRGLRESAELSQYELARRAGVSRQAVSALEKGDREPSLATAQRLARALGVSVAAFDVMPVPGEVQPASEPLPRPLGKRK